MMFGDGAYMIGMHGLWWLFWIVVIGLLLLFAWGPGQRGAGRSETPREILLRRLSSGDITPAQYEERRALLDRDGAG